MYQVTKKAVNVLPPAAIVNNTTFPCNVIDCAGSEYLEVFVILGALDIAITTLKLQESDVKASGTSLTGGVDISVANGLLPGQGTVVGTDSNDTGVTSTLPTATSDNNVFKFEVDLRGRKRYILPVITIGNGATGGFCTVLAELGRGGQVATTAADRGYAEVMRV